MAFPTTLVEFSPTTGPFAVPVWVDLSARVLEAEWADGKQADLSEYPPGQGSIVFDNSDRVLDPEYAAGPYFGQLNPRVPFRIRARSSALVLTGAAGSYVTTPATPDVTGDFEIRVKMALTDWSTGAGQVIWGQTNGFGVADGGYNMAITAAGLVSITWSTGVAFQSADSTVTLEAAGYVNGQTLTVSAYLDADNGAAGRTVYFRVDAGSGWVPLGTPVTTAGTTVGAIATPIGPVLGADIFGNNRAAGSFYRFELFDGMPTGAQTTAAAAIFENATPGATTITDSAAGFTWTVSPPGSITAAGYYTDLFYGFVEDGWEQGYSPPAVATCTVKLVDLLGVLSGYTLPSVLGAAIVALGPVGYWPLDETQGATTVADHARAYDGTVIGEVELGADPLGTGLGTSAQFNGLDQRVDITRSVLVPMAFGQNWTVTAIVATTTPGDVDTLRPIWQQVAGNASADLYGIFVNAAGKVDLYNYARSIGWTGVSLTAVTDGEPHLIIAMVDPAGPDDGIAIDNADTVYTAGVGSTQSGNGVAIGGTPLALKNYDDNYFDGRIGHVAVWDRVLTLPEREAIVAGRYALDGARSGAQIAWALDQIGVPAGMRDLDVGVQIMGPAVTNGLDALAFMRQVAATEQGDLYVAHHDGGKLRFRDRYASFQDARSMVAQAVFSDDPTVADIAACRVEPGSLVVEPNGVSSIINQASVTWVGGEETWDESAGSPYGPHPISVTTQAPNPLTARGVGQWIVANNSVPAAKIKALTVNPGANHAEFPMALTARIADRAEYRSHPQSVGAATTKTLEILGRRTAVAGVEWRTTFYLTEHPDNGADWFTLGVSQLGGTHVLAF